MDVLQEINWGIIAPFIVIQGILMIVALIDWFRTKETNGSRWLWLFVIIFLNTIGPIFYFVIGRRQR
ncbi:PLD nuclease N-terminal domain-containing protein [Virgibacillus sp. LDC-1]|uniref:PLD nuclease N-terminal domain-containing protein n=1 Tax=Virgibacillus sp. LDC-1 TaxID=3039856 RepID=UPI0024DEC80B|nr:PLD nuclease N-terminal domain-containing protein [Virgibacillus sp. LDC-1]